MSTSKKIPLAPYPKSLEFARGEIDIAAGGSIFLDDSALYKVVKTASRDCPALYTLKVVLKSEAKAPVAYVCRDASLENEAYRISVTPKDIKISYGEPCGAFYALCTRSGLFVFIDTSQKIC